MTPGNLVTLGYNRARAREATGALREAAEEYKNILEAFPAYMDCYIRLSCIASRRGAGPEAHEWANKALAVQPDNPDVLGLLGAIPVPIPVPVPVCLFSIQIRRDTNLSFISGRTNGIVCCLVYLVCFPT
jgi:tetratricopeptide (TPR) repeat protein